MYTNKLKETTKPSYQQNKNRIKKNEAHKAKVKAQQHLARHVSPVNAQPVTCLLVWPRLSHPRLSWQRPSKAAAKRLLAACHHKPTARLVKQKWVLGVSLFVFFPFPLLRTPLIRQVLQLRTKRYYRAAKKDMLPDTSSCGMRVTDTGPQGGRERVKPQFSTLA